MYAYWISHTHASQKSETFGIQLIETQAPIVPYLQLEQSLTNIKRKSYA